jgi:hypothetical protein
MTLLLNLVGPSGIHLSSDFRLTEIRTRRSIEDSFGSKQLPLSFNAWSAHLSFTGIAEINGRKTLDWISQAMQAMPQSTEASAAMVKLASVATSEFLAIPRSLRQLTIVVAVVQAGHAARLFVLSCSERPDGPPLADPLEQFEVYEFSSDSPQVLIFGYTNAVSVADRKFLKKLNRGRLDPEEIRAALARVNARSAKASNEFISTGCLVTSVLPQGTVASENFGRTPGIPIHMVGSPEEVKLIAQSVTGKPAFVQSREARAEKAHQLTLPPMNVSEGNTLIVKVRQQGPASLLFVTDAVGNTFTAMPGTPGPGDKTPEAEDAEYDETHRGEEVGEPRTFALLSPTVSASITDAKGSTLGAVTIGGVSQNVSIGKNQLTKAVLNAISVQLDPSARYEGRPTELLLNISSKPTIDGAQPHAWTYAIDVLIDGTFSFSIRRMSMAFRSSHHKSPMAVLGNSEELVMMAPRNRIALKVFSGEPTANAIIEARFVLRDFPN